MAVVLLGRPIFGTVRGSAYRVAMPSHHVNLTLGIDFHVRSGHDLGRERQNLRARQDHAVKLELKPSLAYELAGTFGVFEMQIDRGTSVPNFEMPHLRSSAISSTRSSRSTSGDELGGDRLQLETHDERSWSSPVGRRAGSSVNCFRMSVFTPELFTVKNTTSRSGTQNIVVAFESRVRFVTV
jgi:hypothetical protein